MLWGTKKPCVRELADLSDKLEAERGDALVYGGGVGGGDVVEEEVVERRVVGLGGGVEGGDEACKEDEGDGGEPCHDGERGSGHVSAVLSLPLSAQRAER